MDAGDVLSLMLDGDDDRDLLAEEAEVGRVRQEAPTADAVQGEEEALPSKPEGAMAAPEVAAPASLSSRSYPCRLRLLCSTTTRRSTS